MGRAEQSEVPPVIFCEMNKVNEHRKSISGLNRVVKPLNRATVKSICGFAALLPFHSFLSVKSKFDFGIRSWAKFSLLILSS